METGLTLIRDPRASTTLQVQLMNQFISWQSPVWRISEQPLSLCSWGSRSLQVGKSHATLFAKEGAWLALPGHQASGSSGHCSRLPSQGTKCSSNVMVTRGEEMEQHSKKWREPSFIVLLGSEELCTLMCSDCVRTSIGSYIYTV